MLASGRAVHSQESITAAVAAFHEGDVARARRLAEKQLSDCEQSPVLLHLIGLIECRSGEVDAGLPWLRRACEADPANVGFRLDYVRMLIGIGRIREALDEIEQVSRAAVAQAVALDGRSEPTVAVSDVADLTELGLLLDRSNQLDGLRQLLVSAESAGVPPEALGYLRACLALRDGRPEMAKRFLESDPRQAAQPRRHRLMTKIADALGDAGEAFAAATAMNLAVPGYDEWRRRAAHYRAQIRATADIVTPEWASRIAHARDCNGVPELAFLVGFPRSGTTLLDTFLMGHPETFVVEEGKMLELATGVVSSSRTLDWPPDLVIQAREAYLRELSLHVPADHRGLVVDKHPLNMLRLPVLHALFPRAKVIFAQRHPCDVVLSGFMQDFQLNHAMASFLDLADAADFYDSAMAMWTRSREAFPQPTHIVVYERLTAEPAAELRPTLEFLGLDWCEEMLDHQATAKGRGAIFTASYDQVVQPLSQAPSGRWRRYRKQLEPVLPVLLPWAEQLGYAD